MIIRYIAVLWKWYVRQGYPCLFRLLTGFYCPGCGGTRALAYLLRGQVLTSLYYHPLVVYMAVMAAVESGLWAAGRIWGYRGGKRPYEKEIYVGLGILAVNWAVKNWALAACGVHLIP